MLAVEWARARGVPTRPTKSISAVKLVRSATVHMLAEGKPDLVVAFPGGRGDGQHGGAGPGGGRASVPLVVKEQRPILTVDYSWPQYPNRRAQHD
jgi:hypothetical protein